jgi:hypothetical protein
MRPKTRNLVVSWCSNSQCKVVGTVKVRVRHIYGDVFITGASLILWWAAHSAVTITLTRNPTLGKTKQKHIKQKGGPGSSLRGRRKYITINYYFTKIAYTTTWVLHVSTSRTWSCYLLRYKRKVVMLDMYIYWAVHNKRRYAVTILTWPRTRHHFLHPCGKLLSARTSKAYKIYMASGGCSDVHVSRCRGGLICDGRLPCSYVTIIITFCLFLN